MKSTRVAALVLVAVVLATAAAHAHAHSSAPGPHNSPHGHHGLHVSPADSYRHEVFGEGIGSEGVHSFDLVSSAGGEKKEVSLMDHIEGGFVEDAHRPVLKLTVKDKKVVAIAVAFPAPYSLAAPAFTIHAISKGGREANVEVVPVAEFAPMSSPGTNPDKIGNDLGKLAVDNEVNVPLVNGPIPTANMPHITMFTIDVVRTSISTFVYGLKSVPEDIVNEERMYDFFPANRTMNIKFLGLYNKTTDEFGIWVQRRPPIPNFSLLVACGDDVIAHLNLKNIDPNGVGSSNMISGFKARIDKPFRVVTFFYENPRHHRAVAIVDDVFALVEKMTATKDSEERARGERVKTNMNGNDVMFHYHEHLNFIGASMTQGHPVANMMLTVSAGGSDDAEGGETANDLVLFREEERHVPYIDPEEKSQFGWYHTITSNTTLLNELVTVTGTKKIKFVFDFDDREDMHPVTLMNKWITDNGGDVAKVMLDDVSGRQLGHTRYTLHEKGVVSTEAVAKEKSVATIPYRVLLSNIVAELNPHIAKIKEISEPFKVACKRLQVDYTQTAHFMQMSLFMIMQPNHELDGTNWRLYFDTIPKDHPPLPFFYTEDEMDLFKFSPMIKIQSDKIRELWQAEFHNIAHTNPWVQHHVTFERYTVVRSHVESRVYNFSGVLVMVPLMDYVNHDDSPNVVLRFDDDHKVLRFDASREIAKNEAITLDYGVSMKSKLDFLLQFGFTPPAAHDAVMVLYESSSKQGNVSALLTTEKESRKGLMQVIKEDLQGEKQKAENDKDAPPPIVTERECAERLQTVLKKVLAGFPEGEIPNLTHADKRNKHNTGRQVVHAANVIMQSERLVLNKHLEWLASDVF